MNVVIGVAVLIIGIKGGEGVGFFLVPGIEPKFSFLLSMPSTTVLSPRPTTYLKVYNILCCLIF